MKAMKENSTTHGNYDVAIVSMETQVSKLDINKYGLLLNARTL